MTRPTQSDRDAAPTPLDRETVARVIDPKTAAKIDKIMSGEMDGILPNGWTRAQYCRSCYLEEINAALAKADAILALWPTGEGVSGGVAPHVFLDCDGVLADFDTYAHAYFGKPPRQAEKEMGSDAFWASLEAKGDFYRNLPLMADARALYEGVKHLHPTILTGCPRGTWAQGQKVEWAAEHFPGVPIITCRSADKRDYAKPGDVLIDDWAQHRHRWIEMGGVFITHHDAASSLAALWAHYPKIAPPSSGGER